MSKNTEDFKELLESVLNGSDSFMVHVFENSGELGCDLDEIYTESHHQYRQSYAVKNAEETHRVLKAIMHDHHVIIRNNGNVIASVHPQNFNVKHQFEFKVGGRKRASYKRFRSLHHYPKQNKLSSKLLRYKDTLDHVQSAINLNGGYTSHNSFTIHTFKT